jgi:hypothetical protein
MLTNLLKRIINKAGQLYNQMTGSPRRIERKLDAKTTKIIGCRTGHKLADKTLSSVHIKIPGKKAYHCISVKDDERVSSLKKRMADRLGVDTKNWGIYASKNRNEAPEIVDDEKKVNQIGHTQNLYFYPRIVIR